MKNQIMSRIEDGRFVPITCTPKKLVDMMEYGERGLKAFNWEDAKFKLTSRFNKSLAVRMGVPYSVFKLFAPEEVMSRAAEVNPNLKLRLTLDCQEGKALALTEQKGLPVPVRYVSNTLLDDPRLLALSYREGVLFAHLNLGEIWKVNNDSEYQVHAQCRVPVDGYGSPEFSLATWRQVCQNGAVAEVSIFRTKMEIKDNNGSHFKRLLQSFANPEGVELLQARMSRAAETKASAAEFYALEELIRKLVSSDGNRFALIDRLHEMASNPCVRYGVTSLGCIGTKKRGLLPVDCSVSDLLNFASELSTHYAHTLLDIRPLHAYTGTLLSKDFDLEDLYPNARRISRFYLNDLNLVSAA